MSALSSGGTVSSVVVEQLHRTKGWTRFLSVMLWLFILILIVLGGALVLFSQAADSLPESMGQVVDGMVKSFGGFTAMLWIGICYILMAVVYIYPASKLGRFSGRCSQLAKHPVEGNLIGALEEMRRFWKYVGLWMLLILFLYALLIGVGIFFPTLVFVEKSPDFSGN
ncbi:MAG: hypothetical protein AAGA96_02510 [Verrucomicrobiota bacterium]